MDACFANYHCNDLPNTHCTMDKNVPKFNNSCQCIKGNKPFDPDPRTGLIEGCAPLTDADKATILGCATRFKIDPDPRTGLIEGCAPLTDADKATILGCATRFKIDPDPRTGLIEGCAPLTDADK